MTVSLDTNVCWYKREADAFPCRLDPARGDAGVSDEALSALMASARELATEPGMRWVVLTGDTSWSTPIEVFLAPAVRSDVEDLARRYGLPFGPALARWLRSELCEAELMQLAAAASGCAAPLLTPSETSES